MDTTNSSKVFLDRYLTPIAVIVAAVIIAFAFIYGRGMGGAAPAPAGTATAPAVDIAKVTTKGEPFIGEANAPVTMALFYDYQCPFCKQFEQTVSPQLVANYVKTGKLKIVFKDFQFLGNDSLDAAVFGRALWESQPDKFYDWYVAMFNAQDDEGDKGFGKMSTIDTLAKTIPGLDVAKVDALVKSKGNEYIQLIDASRAEGAAMGINGTPSIVVGKKLFTGMSPEQFYAGISAEVTAELK
ncbi:MAG: protein-disulfide isomerase [Parcubacteria group bacterium]|nr:protein-disulfide isomerase [Parcubacteria group bacterium]